MPSDWTSFISSTVSNSDGLSPSSILICGPKSSGKSTFCRLLVNATLSRGNSSGKSRQEGATNQNAVAFLDLDPGQPEFSPPGDLSLVWLKSCILGPPFVHPTPIPQGGNTILRQHAFGYLSPRDDPSHYLECVIDLFSCFLNHSRSSRSPLLIINCSGWIQGDGLELLKEHIRVLMATKVVFMTASDETTRDILNALSTQKASVHAISAQPFTATLRTASSLRSMQTSSYFHLTDSEDSQLRWDPRPLSERAPLVAYYSGPEQSIFAIMVVGEEVNPNFFEIVLKGSVVSIVIIEDDAALPVSASANHTRGLPRSDLSSSPESANRGVSQSQDGPRSTASDPEKVTVRESFENGEKGENAPHLNHPSIRHSTSQIPFIASVNRTTRPLSPQYTRSIGQALIRSIDRDTHAFHLLTPIPSAELQALHEAKSKIVLVRGGRLDAPTWAYEEPFVFERARRRRVEREIDSHMKTGKEQRDDDDDGQDDRGGDKYGDDEEDSLEQKVERTPWAEIRRDNPPAGGLGDGARGKSKGTKKRSGRRDLRYRSQGQVVSGGERREMERR